MIPQSVQNLCDWVVKDAEDLQEPRELVRAVLEHYAASAPTLSSQHKYLFCAHKPESGYSCYGHWSNYSADFLFVKSNELAEIIEAYAACLARELDDREEGYTTLEVYGPSEEVAGIIAEAQVQAEAIKLARIEQRRLDEERKKQERAAFALQVRRSHYEALRAEFEAESKKESRSCTPGGPGCS